MKREDTLAWMIAIYDPDGSMMELAQRLIVQLAATLVYLAPSIIAQHNQHPKQIQILILNITLGWTIIGWLIALKWALESRPR